LTLISAGNGTSLSLFDHIARIAQMRFIATRVARSLVSSSICVRTPVEVKAAANLLIIPQYLMACLL